MGSSRNSAIGYVEVAQKTILKVIINKIKKNMIDTNQICNKIDV